MDIPVLDCKAARAAHSVASERHELRATVHDVADLQAARWVEHRLLRTNTFAGRLDIAVLSPVTHPNCGLTDGPQGLPVAVKLSTGHRNLMVVQTAR